MKCLLISLIVFAIDVNSVTRKSLLLPQLPVGNYRINFLAMMRCTPAPSNNYNQFNLYLSKKTANTSEIMGNITHLQPFDDSLDLEFDLAVKDSIGGWKENAFFYKVNKACSGLKMLFGDAWNPLMSGIGMNNITCPVPEGYYKLPGLDTAIFKSTNFPKTFFYGTYRFRARFTKNKIVYGCFIAVVEVKRPWETD
ncbi:hypothetical protein QTP88_002884 [Uroleucon formosanum]